MSTAFFFEVKIMGFKDECGVTGVFGAENAASLCYFALTSLQHRGQESAGIAVSDGSKIKLHKNMGLVSDVFEQRRYVLLIYLVPDSSMYYLRKIIYLYTKVRVHYI